MTNIWTLPTEISGRSWSATRGAGISDEGNIAQAVVLDKLGDRKRHYDTQYNQRPRGAAFTALALAASIICDPCLVVQQPTHCEGTPQALLGNWC